MKSKGIEQLNEAVKQHRNAISVWKQQKEDPNFLFLGLSKSFEVVVEYSWRLMKFIVEDEGLDAPSPKEAVRKAAQLGIIQDPKKWIDCINVRNDSVHNYFGLPKDQFIKLTEETLTLAEDLMKSVDH